MGIFKAAIILFLVLILQVNLFVPFLQEPLERDEGAYAYIAQRLPAGELPYRDSFDHKPPAIYFTYALIFRFFGESILSIRIFTLAISLLSTLLVFAIGFWFWGSGGGLLSAFLYALFSGGPYIQGTSANTETFMLLPMLLAFYLFLLGSRKNPHTKKFGVGMNLFAAGLFSGLAVMFKPVALLNFLALFMFSFFLPESSRKEKIQKLAALLFGFLVFPLLFAAYFWLKQAGADFIYAVFTYNLAYIKGQVWSWAGFLQVSLFGNSILWLLAAAATLYVLLKDRKYENLLLVSWALLSVLGVISGKTFYGHYFIQAIPALVLLSSYALLKYFDEPAINISRILLVIVIFFLSLILIVYQIGFYFSTPEQITFKKYGFSNFADAREVARYVKASTSPEENIFVWGVEPEIYFYSQRKSASKYIYYYPLFMGKELRLKPLVDEITINKPKEIILAAPIYRNSSLGDYINLRYRKIANFRNWEVWERLK